MFNSQKILFYQNIQNRLNELQQSISIIKCKKYNKVKEVLVKSGILDKLEFKNLQMQLSYF